MAKYKEDKPLFLYAVYSPDKFSLEYRDIEPPKPIKLSDFIGIDPIGNISGDMIFGIKRSHEDFTQHNFLKCYEGGIVISHQRIINVLNEVCPHDFQAFPIIIKNIRPTDPEIRNQDYYIIKMLHELDVLDFKQSRLRFRNPQNLNDFDMIRPVFKENSMGEHHLGYIKKEYSAYEIISPYLANHLTKLKLTKGTKFLTEEQAYPQALPEEYLQYMIMQGKFEGARRYFITLLNNQVYYDELKKYLHLLPVSTVEKLIELTLERSTFHQQQCDELKALLKS